jgi:C1A family cysteine protease
MNKKLVISNSFMMAITPIHTFFIRNIVYYENMKTILFIMLLVSQPCFAHGKDKTYHVKKYNKKHHKGLKKHKRKLEIEKKFHTSGVSVPGSFDMRTKWPLPCGVFDQGQCGSCVYHSVTQNYQYSLSIRGVLPAGDCPLAREELMNCIPNGGQCEGDYFENVAGGLVGLKGLVAESTYPYTGTDGKCKKIKSQVFGPIKSMQLIDTSPKSVITAMYQGYPVSNTVAAGSGDFMDYTGGIYNGCASGQTDHETLFIGWDCETSIANGNCVFGADGDTINHDGHWIDLNSWGASWGEGGAIRIKMHAVDGQSIAGNRCNEIGDEVGILETGLPVAGIPTPIPVIIPTPTPTPAPECGEGFLCNIKCWSWCH